MLDFAGVVIVEADGDARAQCQQVCSPLGRLVEFGDGVDMVGVG
ncbi:MAG TPA: hypothetical protein VNM16_09175 [Bacillota bacterium]|nr:hypothetical protein [Bacillota bacterium]